ncbi:MAG: YlmC/YmxH family sporulation protein [Clostridia bacterium]|nr:YlmC/YmxH family sporulation protein [Clostridia bacterium]
MEILTERCITVRQLKEKEVINIRDGSRLGYPCDIKFDLCTGRVTAIILPEHTGLWGVMGKDEGKVIPWDSIEKIGDDIILVKCEVFVKCDCEEHPKKSRFF